MEDLAALIAGEDKSLSEAVAELQERGFCKFQITIGAVKDKPVSDGLDSSFPMPCDALASYILDERLYRRIVSACSFCKTPRDVRNRVLNLLKQAGILDEWTINSKEFMDALLEHLVNLKNVKNGADLLHRLRLIKNS